MGQHHVLAVILHCWPSECDAECRVNPDPKSWWVLPLNPVGRVSANLRRDGWLTLRAHARCSRMLGPTTRWVARVARARCALEC
eukprot:359460-Chlamydomonas_euryale.AAC.3